jgi:hypothetical protein
LVLLNVTYVALARKFAPATRTAIISGEDTTNFSALLNQPKTPFALPKPKRVSDAELEDLIRIAGLARALDAAIAVETRVGRSLTAPVNFESADAAFLKGEQQ